MYPFQRGAMLVRLLGTVRAAWRAGSLFRGLLIGSVKGLIKLYTREDYQIKINTHNNLREKIALYGQAKGKS